MNEQIEELKRRVIHPNATEINIRRLPKKELSIFKKFANEEFLGDYGMAFKELVQTMLVKPSEFGPVYEILNNHEQRICVLEGKGSSSPREVIHERRTLSGRVIRWKSKIGGEDNGREKGSAEDTGRKQG
jgi:hypothetical protein